MQKYWNTVQDERGNPRYGASVSVQQNGVNSSIYTDSGGLVPAANPLTTDSTRGYFEFYAAAGTYDLVVFGVGFSSYTITAGANLGLPSGDVTFTQSGTGTVAQTAQAKMREMPCSLEDLGGVVGTDCTAAFTKAYARGGEIKLGAGTYSDTLARTLTGNVKFRGQGIGITTISNSVAGIALTIQSNNNVFEGIDLVAASATEGIRIGGTGGAAYNRVECTVTTAAAGAIALKMFSDDVSRGVFQNQVKARLTSGGNAYKEVITGTGFLGNNEFTGGVGLVWRTTADPGTVAILNGSQGAVFNNSDASNYGVQAGNKSWDVQGTTSYPKWDGGLVDTAAANTGFAFAAGVTGEVVVINNQAGTPFTWAAASGNPSANSFYRAGNFRVGALYMPTPSFGASSPPIVFYDTGNNGAQNIFANSGWIKVGLDTTTGQFWLNPANGTIIAVANTAPPAGGTAGLGVRMSSTANFGVFFGSGAPTLSAAKGSFYMRTDGSGTTDRAYINTNGSTTWTALTTVA